VRRRLAGATSKCRATAVSRSSMPLAASEKTMHADTGRHECVPAFELESSERLSTRQARKDEEPDGPCSGADVGRQVLAGEGGASGDKVRGRALEDDAAAVVTGAGAEVDDPVGVRHHGLVVLDDDD
jgi:hypothetical protein